MNQSRGLPQVRIAVLLAVKNGADKLACTLDSLHKQTLSKKLFTVYVYDDGSTDATPQLLEAAAREGKCVVLGRNAQSIGLTKTLNLLVGQTSSDFVARMDCGDTCAPERLEHQLQYLELHSEVAAVCSSVKLFIAPNTFVGPIFEPLGYELSAIQLRFKNPVVHGSVMLRREVFETIGLYDENCRFAQDLDLWLRILTFGRPIHWMKEYLYFLEVDPHGISAQNATRQAEISNDIRAGLFEGFTPTKRKMSLWRMCSLARLRKVPVLGRAFRLLESVIYEFRCRMA